jgi:hypothetical protein
MNHCETFFCKTGEYGDLIPIKLLRNTYSSLAKHLLREYLDKAGHNFTTKGRFEFVEEVVTEYPQYSYYTCLRPIAEAIAESYTLHKSKGVYPLSKRDHRQVVFIIMKTLERGVNEHKNNK